MASFFSTPLKTSKSNVKSSFGWVVFGLFLFFSIVSNAQKKRDLLTAIIQKDVVESLDSTIYKPFEKKEFHNRLINLPKDVQKKILSDAKEIMTYNWPSIPATAYLDYKRSGDRMGMEKYWSDGLDVLKKLVLAEVLEGEGRFLDAIINGSWAVCEQSTWVLSAHLPSQKGGAGIPNINDPIIDLGAGETASTLAWTYYFFNEDFETQCAHARTRAGHHRAMLQTRLDDQFARFLQGDLFFNMGRWIAHRCAHLSEFLQQVGGDVAAHVVHQANPARLQYAIHFSQAFQLVRQVMQGGTAYRHGQAVVGEGQVQGVADLEFDGIAQA